MAADHNIGLIGLGVMGQNLALNIAQHGFRVAVYDREPDVCAAFAAAAAPTPAISVHATPQALVAALRPPRNAWLMVKAGAPVDQHLSIFTPLLEPDATVADGGNSHYVDTQRRAQALLKQGVHYLGIGVSGGEYGARHGPSLMVGGERAGYERLQGVLHAIAAKVNDEPCCAYVGGDAAGHFVKMIHNGIEYAAMQLIAEIYHILKALKLPYPTMQALFNDWNRGPLNSYLLEITGDILGTHDPETGLPLVELIVDRAEQKGTGQWATQAALGLGVPVPTLGEAVAARALSALKTERLQAERLFSLQTINRLERGLVEALPGALLAANVCVYAQGFAVLKAANFDYGWQLPLAEISKIWRGGCIIRAGLLNDIYTAFQRDAGLANLLLDAHFQTVLQRHHIALRRVVATTAAAGLPTPALGSALAYFDAYRNGRLPANLIQAQRDYFGAHRYERLDKPGAFHTEWAQLKL